MKRLFIPILTLIFALACTPDNGGNGDNTGNNGGYTPTGKITVEGMVYGDNKPLAGVVVSDGFLCVTTDSKGYFQIDSDLSKVQFVHCSLPSGYKAQNDENGLPQFYHRVTDAERKAEKCQVTFDLNSVKGNPERYTLIVGADPQPRSRGAGYDNIAYHALDCCEDFYRDMREKAATITDREVYGMMLGDIVHESMSLYADYVNGLSTLGFPMFNIIGNHDNDKTAANDVEGRRKFEEYLGPTYYSFNLGKQHYIVLDNLIMYKENGELTAYNQGLTDEIWQWMQNDLRYVDFSTTIMVAAHSPMFKLYEGGERSTSAATSHGRDYGLLLAKYAKVHAWAGHSHTTFNHIYSSTHEYANIEVHTVARSTGELWTNDYLASGTPRGYTVVEVDGDDMKWYYKSEGHDRDYQMNVYAPTRTGGELVKANIWNWSPNYWSMPEWWENGKMVGYMTHLPEKDVAYLEDHAKQGPFLGRKGDDKAVPHEAHGTFHIKPSEGVRSGEVRVTDNFGKTYIQKVEW